MDRSITRRGLLFGGLGALGLAATRTVPVGAGAATSLKGHAGHATIRAGHRTVAVHPAFVVRKRDVVVATVENYDSNAAVCAVEIEGDHFEIMLTFTPKVDVPIGWVYFER